MTTVVVVARAASVRAVTTTSERTSGRRAHDRSGAPTQGSRRGRAGRAPAVESAKKEGAPLLSHACELRTMSSSVSGACLWMAGRNGVGRVLARLLTLRACSACAGGTTPLMLTTLRLATLTASRGSRRSLSHSLSGALAARRFVARAH